MQSILRKLILAFLLFPTMSRSADSLSSTLTAIRGYKIDSALFAVCIGFPIYKYLIRITPEQAKKEARYVLDHCKTEYFDPFLIKQSQNRIKMTDQQLAQRLKNDAIFMGGLGGLMAGMYYHIFSHAK